MLSYLRRALTTALIFGALDWVVHFVLHRDALLALTTAVTNGLIFGFVFSALMWSFQEELTNSAHPSALRNSALPKLSTDEQVLKEGAANYFKGWGGAGGLLFLTDHRILFKSHCLNIQEHELSLPLTDIERATPYLVWGLVRTGLQVQTKQGEIERFVVSDREAWATAITGSISAQE